MIFVRFITKKTFFKSRFSLFSWSKEKSWSISITDCLNLIKCLYRKWRTNNVFVVVLSTGFSPGNTSYSTSTCTPWLTCSRYMHTPRATCTQNRMHIPSSIKGLGETCFDTLIIWKSPSVCSCGKAAIHTLVSPSYLLNCDSVWQHCS